MNRSSLINRQFICYLTGLLILAIGSNLFLKADLGVAPSCTIALALTRLFSFGNYAFFNFLTNFALLVFEILIEKKAGKKQLREIRRHIGMISQSFNLVKRSTVQKNVLSGLNRMPESARGITTNKCEKADKHPGREQPVCRVFGTILKKSNEKFTNLNEKPLTSLST